VHGHLKVLAMQSGWNPQTQPQQMQQPQQPIRQAAPLARQQYAAAPVFLDLSQVKQYVLGATLDGITAAETFHLYCNVMHACATANSLLSS
jgi:hypothetical protein